MTCSLIYITVPNEEAAIKISRYLLEKKLAACINIIENVKSLYCWEGKIEEGSEKILLAKTTKNLVSTVVDAVKSLHEYECPAIFSIKIEDGEKNFLKWIENSVKDDIS